MQKLIRGLLIRDPDARWGYDEITKYLTGEDVPIRSHIPFVPLGGEDRTSLEEIADVIEGRFAFCKKEICDENLKVFIKDEYPEVSGKFNASVAKASAPGMEDDDAKLIVLWALRPDYPLVLPNGFEADSLDDVRRLTIQAPETMYQKYRNFNSALYEFLELKGAGGKIPEVKRVVESNMNTPEEECLPLLREIAGILSEGAEPQGG